MSNSELIRILATIEEYKLRGVLDPGLQALRRELKRALAPEPKPRFTRGTKVRVKPEFAHLYPELEPGQVYEVFDTILDRICLGGELNHGLLCFSSKFDIVEEA